MARVPVYTAIFCFVCTFAFACTTRGPGTDSGTPPLGETICDDMIDNDSDGFIDCDDSDCMNDPGCGGAARTA